MTEEGGGDQPPEKDPDPWYKTCCYAILDCIAMIIRTIVATWRAIVWVTRRSCYPIKEACYACCDTWSAWSQPYRSKQPTKPAVAGFRFGVDDDPKGGV